MRNFFTFFILCIAVCVFAQPTLNPHIGWETLPPDNEPICMPSIPYNPGYFDDEGYAVGGLINNFTLFTLDDTRLNIAEKLSEGKPVLLVAGSYTCHVYRNQLSQLQWIKQQFGDQVEIFVVYTIEAHPMTDDCVYVGEEWQSSQNIQEGLFFRQPTTYAERKELAQGMIDYTDLDVDVLLDGPCNDWWLNFGPAPNNAYLITPDGIVFEKHGWFNQNTNDMACSIENFLNDEGPCNSILPEPDGLFYFSLTDESNSITGEAGDVLNIHGRFINTTDEPVWIDIERTENVIPENWQTSLCVDICLASTVSEHSFYLEPGNIQNYTAYFFTDENTPGTGYHTVKFTNQNDSLNTFTQTFYAETELISSVSDINADNYLSVYPNPVDNGQRYISIEFSEPIGNYAQFNIYNTQGQLVVSEKVKGNITSHNLDIHKLHQGLYILEVQLEGRIISEKFLKR